jgi:hypothetical protein
VSKAFAWLSAVHSDGTDLSKNSTTIRVAQSAKSTTIGSVGCDRYYSKTVENNNFVTIPMDVSAPLIQLIKYSSTDKSKHSTAVMLDVIRGEQ